MIYYIKNIFYAYYINLSKKHVNHTCIYAQWDLNRCDIYSKHNFFFFNLDQIV
jgi:hypothetical protein